MREMFLATLLVGILVPATLNAQSDGGLPDGMASGDPHAAQIDDLGGHTGSSSDPNGNMGNVGRTGRDAGAPDAAPTGAEGNTGNTGGSSGGGQAQDAPRPPAPYTGSSSKIYPGR